MPINSIDSRCCIKKPESRITCITGYSGFISRELFLMAWGVDTHTHTHTHTHTNTHTDVHTKVISRNQTCTSHRPAHAWVKNYIDKYRFANMCYKRMGSKVGCFTGFCHCGEMTTSVHAHVIAILCSKVGL